MNTSIRHYLFQSLCLFSSYSASAQWTHLYGIISFSLFASFSRPLPVPNEHIYTAFLFQSLCLFLSSYASAQWTHPYAIIYFGLFASFSRPLLVPNEHIDPALFMSVSLSLSLVLGQCPMNIYIRHYLFQSLCLLFSSSATGQWTHLYCII
jgi:hypothetical protein